MCSILLKISWFLLGITVIPVIGPDATTQQKVLRAPTQIGDHKLKHVNDLGDMLNFNEILDNILIPRVVGSLGHTRVKEYIKKSMANLDWSVEIDAFDDDTPNMGKLRFENVIATLNPKAERFLILACHYDSKYFPNEEFLGATDSAVPCAMLINMATVMQTLFEQNHKVTDYSLKFVFFDGEEAFKEWSATDSIYGARHLAAKWDQEGFLPKIDMLVLLDLIGAPDPLFFSFFSSTESWYIHLYEIEQRYSESGLASHYTFSGTSGANSHAANVYFQPRSIKTQIEDDHIPFLIRGVPILHLIPIPFPTVWHTMNDNRTVVDLKTVEDLNRILRVFLIEYLHLEV